MDSVRATALQARARRASWAEIAKQWPGVKIGTLKRIAYDPKYEPKDAEIRSALGLPCYAPGRVCPEHGVVHDHIHHAKPAWLAQAVANLRALERQANDGR